MRYPDSQDNILREETIIYDLNGQEYISLENENGIPLRVRYMGTDVEVVRGSRTDCFWLGKACEPEIEANIFMSLSGDLTPGAVQIVQLEQERRFTVIKIGNAYFCKEL